MFYFRVVLSTSSNQGPIVSFTCHKKSSKNTGTNKNSKNYAPKLNTIQTERAVIDFDVPLLNTIYKYADNFVSLLKCPDIIRM